MGPCNTENADVTHLLLENEFFQVPSLGTRVTAANVSGAYVTKADFGNMGPQLVLQLCISFTVIIMYSFKRYRCSDKRNYCKFLAHALY